MTLFLLLGTGMVLLALALVIVPLLRRLPRSDAELDASLAVLADGVRELERERAAGTLAEAEYERARGELERQVLALQAPAGGGRVSVQANWGAALAMAVAMPLLVLLVYTGVGEPTAVLQPQLLAQAAPAADGHISDDEAIQALSRRLAREPSDAEGWVLLARSYFQVRRLGEAVDAYARATELMGDNPDLLVEYANTLAMAHDRDLSGEPEQLVTRALAIDPDHPTALVFAGLAAFQRDDHELALQHWQRLRSLTPEGSEDRVRVDALIARAGGESPLAPTVTAASASAPPGIRGTVTIDAALAGKVAGSDTLFIFARAADGPPMPLAALRARAGDLPLNFTLDDSSAMAADMVLSRFDRVDIVARVSRLGDPAAQPGDIEGRIENVAVGSGDVRLVLDRVIGR